MNKRWMYVFLILLAVVLAVAPVVAPAMDLRSNTLPKNAISPDTSVSNNDNTTSDIIDRLGYGSVTFVIQSGTLADSDVTLTPTIQVCAIDNCDDAASASATYIVGSATFAATDDNTAKSIGYTGTARYVRIVITPASNTSAARFGAVCILGHKQYGPAQ